MTESRTLEGGYPYAPWTLMAPQVDDNDPSFGFAFERDDGSGKTDYVHIPVEQVAAVIEFFQEALASADDPPCDGPPVEGYEPLKPPPVTPELKAKFEAWRARKARERYERQGAGS